MKSVILSCEGLTLSSAERDFFRDFRPLGFILFKRNIDNKHQLKELCTTLRDVAGHDCPILIDQEGGRVRRMRPPHWPDYPAMKEIGDLDDKDRLIETIRGMSGDLREVGIDVNCAPVLDVLCPDTHDAIGDRAFSTDPEMVTVLGRLACEVFLEEGITPVIKHIPGQGRASQDSHYNLPIVSNSYNELCGHDFVPFRHLAAKPFAPKIWGMVSHIVYSAIDPDHPASVSVKITALIREDIGFKGLLVSDDLGMAALARYGSLADRVERTLEAGLDIALYCGGKLDDMTQIAKVCPSLHEESLKRYDASKLR